MKEYKKLTKDNSLAELIGVILGDGCITKFERTEALRVVCNSKDKKYACYVADLIKKVFGKQATCIRRKRENAIDIRLYQKYISARLKLPAGNKIVNNVGVPKWIYRKYIYMIFCLKGIFNTDGHFKKNIDNYLHVIELTNHCKHILNDTFKMLKKLGFNPQLGKKCVRLARKEEVYRFIKIIDFRNERCPVV